MNNYKNHLKIGSSNSNMFLHDLNLVHNKTTTNDAYTTFNTVSPCTRILNNGIYYNYL